MEPHNLSDSTQNSSNTMTSSSSSSTSTTPLGSFESEKILTSTPKSNSPHKTQPSSKPQTPSKSIQLRARTRGVSFSPNQLSKLAEKASKLDSKAKDSIKLPERYELFAKFFDNMQSTIRLLTLKRTVRSFTNIVPSVESLSERRFSYTHLAQMKYILPEAIELKKVLSVDPKTCCTKPDLEVSLLLDAVESEGGSGYSNLSKVFRSHLSQFNKAHPEECDIPLGELPEPFNRQIQISHLSSNQNCISPLPVHSSSSVLPEQSYVAASHMSRSFKTRFRRKEPILEAEKTQLLSAALMSSDQSEEAGLSIQTPGSFLPPNPDIIPKLHTLNDTISISVASGCDTIKPVEIDGESVSTLTSTPRPVVSTPKKPVEVGDEEVKVTKNGDESLIDNFHGEGTPTKLTSTPARLMSTTPALQTPKRCHIIQDTASTPSPHKLARRPPRRPLFNTPVKKKNSEEETHETKASSSDAYLINLLPETLRHSLTKKENIINKKQDIAISQAKRRQQMIACLPKLFNMIHLMFQSKNGSIITKEELMHNIISRHLDITDRAELEEQLKLLKELVPDWIQEKVASSGDLLLCINKSSCPDSVRRRLTEAY